MVTANDESGSSINQPYGKGNEHGLNGALHISCETNAGSDTCAVMPDYALIKLCMMQTAIFCASQDFFNPGYRENAVQSTRALESLLFSYIVAEKRTREAGFPGIRYIGSDSWQFPDKHVYIHSRFVLNGCTNIGSL